MSDRNSSRIQLSTEVDVSEYGVHRPAEQVVLTLLQQSGGRVSIALDPVQAHEIGKMLLIPEFGLRVTAMERGTAPA